MKETKKITIKKFIEEYTKRVPQMQEAYLKENLVITNYIPFVKKYALAEKLVDVTIYKFEEYTKEDGTTGRRKTDKIHVDSVAEYLLFCRLVIENYTNLIVETPGFFEEYDMLKESGLLDKLMVGAETVAPLIPMSELSELRSICDLKKKDVIYNATEIHNYVDSLVERFSDVMNVIGKPIMDKVAEQIESKMENDEIKDITDFMEVNE